MANNLENNSIDSTGLEILLYNHQEAKERRECPNKVIAAKPLSSWNPNEVPGAVEGINGSTRKRKRGTYSELEVEKEKKFSLVELYKSDNIDEIILNGENGETTLDPQELLKHLEGWTVEKRKRQEKPGNNRVDKVYRHPKSKRSLRSLVEVKKFVEENSYIRKASDNREVGSQDAQNNIYLQIYQRMEKTFGNIGVQQTSNNNKGGSSSSWSEQRDAISAPKTAWGTTFKSHDNVDLSLHSHRPFQYYQAPSLRNDTNHKKLEFLSRTGMTSHIDPFYERMNKKFNEVPQSRLISDSSKVPVFAGLTSSREQEGVRTIGVRPSHCDVFGAGSSSINTTSSDEIKIMVKSQVETQLQARVATLVEEKVSQYEKTQRRMAERMEGMHRLLVLGGLLPPSQFPN